MTTKTAEKKIRLLEDNITICHSLRHYWHIGNNGISSNRLNSCLRKVAKISGEKLNDTLVLPDRKLLSFQDIDFFNENVRSFLRKLEVKNKCDRSIL